MTGSTVIDDRRPTKHARRTAARLVVELASLDAEFADRTATLDRMLDVVSRYVAVHRDELDSGIEHGCEECAALVELADPPPTGLYIVEGGDVTEVDLDEVDS